MAYEPLVALSVYAFVTSVTPGPSTLMLLASGANFGFSRTVPQILGITLGFKSLLLGVGLGLGAVLTAFPALGAALRISGAAYLLYLAWRIAMSRALASEPRMAGRPLTFLQSAAFQWINPKAWVVALSTMAVYASPDAPFLSVALISVLFSIVNLPTVAVWAGFGVALRAFLADPTRLKWFNLGMGLLLAATLWPMMR